MSLDTNPDVDDAAELYAKFLAAKTPKVLVVKEWDQPKEDEK